MKVITAREMARIDSCSAVPSELLMERAGRGMADFIYDFMPEYPLVFVCGKGHNGGDGFVAARYLAERGRDVKVYAVFDLEKFDGLPRKQLEKLNIPAKKLDAEELKYLLGRRTITVDCIFGTGFKPPLRGFLGRVLEIINKNSKITLSCDIPTGVNGDTGEADKGALDADATITFEYPKVGHFTGPGAAFSGSLEVVNIGTGLSPNKYRTDFEAAARQDIAGYFNRRKKISHKKDYGHIFIIGGSPGLTAAPVMAAEGALRAGAGLVSCAVPEGLIPAFRRLPLSAMTYSAEQSADGTLSEKAVAGIISYIKKRRIDSLIIGPGMGVSGGTGNTVKELLEKTDCPAVIDADGLRSISKNLEFIRKRKAPVLLTPHPGEMAELTGKKTAEIQYDRLAVAKGLAEDLNCTVLLKGYRTVISDGKAVVLNTTGNPAMAVGGSGDILSGIAGALLGQGNSAFYAAQAAAWVHGRSADIAAWKYGERYLSPEEILKGLNRV